MSRKPLPELTPAQLVEQARDLIKEYRCIIAGLELNIQGLLVTHPGQCDVKVVNELNWPGGIKVKGIS